jgi:hypothetical protein
MLTESGSVTQKLSTGLARQLVTLEQNTTAATITNARPRLWLACRKMGGHTLSVFSRSHACAKLIDRDERERQHFRQLRQPESRASRSPRRWLRHL